MKSNNIRAVKLFIVTKKRQDNKRNNNARLRIRLLGILERRDIFLTKAVHEEKKGKKRNALPTRKNFTVAALFRVLVFIYP